MKRVAGTKRIAMPFLAALFLTGCGGQPASTPEKPAEQAQTKPAEPQVPEDIQAAADALLGSGATVLVFGDLAKTGQQQFLAANVIPKSTKNAIPGTIVTRAVIAQNTDGKWEELLRADEHLKNGKGYLSLTPFESVTGWRLQYEQDADKGLSIYITPVKGTEDSHVLPIGIRWNPKVKRYQSLDRSYEHFLPEAPSLGNARSSLR